MKEYLREEKKKNNREKKRITKRKKRQKEIKIETENRIPEFWKEKLNKVRVKGTSSKLLEVVLEEKRREIIKVWIGSGRIN